MGTRFPWESYIPTISFRSCGTSIAIANMVRFGTAPLSNSLVRGERQTRAMTKGRTQLSLKIFTQESEF